MRAQFYSIISILIIIPIFIFVVNYTSYNQKMGKSISERVISDQMNQLEHSIELDTKKAMEISGRRALLAVTNFMINSGIPLSDAEANITSLMLNGNINNTEDFMMINNTMPNWSQRILTNSVNFDVILEYGNITIINTDGFYIKIGMDMNITIEDKLDIARIEKTNLHKVVKISIAGLEDPYFPLNTQGFIRRIIREPDIPYVNRNIVTGSQNTSGTCSGIVTFNKSECDTSKILVTQNVSGIVYACHLGIILEDEDNLTGQIGCYLTGNSSAVSLVQDVVNSWGYDTVYIDEQSETAWSMPIAENLAERFYYNLEGPDFLQRLEGNYSASSDGLLTFIYVPELQEQALEINDDSLVAYRYFSGQGSCRKVRNMPDWFGIDTNDADKLNLTDLLTLASCEFE